MESKTHQTSNSRKKAKVQNARAIHTQKINPDNRQLPKFLDIEKFISSRAFEIGALERSMNLARQASAKRSFQTLPRHLRRRAASHVARRVPIKLRSKAHFEMKNDKPKTISKSVKRKLSLKKYKNRNRTQVLLKRQNGKKWLKTHIWHAKRTKMIEIWGYRLAKTPTEKCFRPTYRASKYGFTLHDLSYYIHLDLTGEPDAIRKVFKNICDPTGVDPCTIRFMPGHRAVEVNLYSHQGWPSSLIGPAVLIWRPISDSPFSPKNPSDELVHSSAELNHSPKSTSARTILLQIHPSTKHDVIEAIRLASENKIQVKQVQELGCLELGGPRCLEKVGRILNGIDDNQKREVVRFFHAGMQPHAVPMGFIIGLTVEDPRLKFPPKKKKTDFDEMSKLHLIQPTVNLARCDQFWDNYKDQNKVKFKKSELDKRRAALGMPGSELEKTEEDDQISILLVRLNDGWRMIMPMEWTKWFFHGLIFSCARLICLDQRAQIDFESGRPSFPRDFPTIKPAIELVNQEGTEEAKYWARKPPAKRVNYKLMDHRGGPSGGDPFIPDWNVVIDQKGIQRNRRAKILDDNETEDVQAEEGVNSGIESGPAWILIGPLLRILIENLLKFADSAFGKESLLIVSQLGLKLMDQIVKKIKMDLGWSQNLHQHWDSALVRIKLIAKGNDGNGGVIQPLARLHWEDFTTEGEKEEKRQLIGLITTGRFALSKGSSMGFGAISLKKLVKIIISQRWKEQNQTMTTNQNVAVDGNTDTNMNNNKISKNENASLPIKFDILYRNKNKPDTQPGRIELIY